MVFAVIGAGIVGCATALALKSRGHDVLIYEKRPDPRCNQSVAASRSINLALSARGLRSLQSIDPSVASVIEPKLMPMTGRMIHSKTGETSAVPYGISGSEAINSIGRASLNNLLLDACEKRGISIRFDEAAPNHLHKLQNLGSTVFACDGAFSKCRGIVAKVTDSKLEIETVKTYYMEIPFTEASSWSPSHLHIWPRGSHMLIALPNADKSFTGTLFAPKEIFETYVADSEKFVEWFSQEFVDAADIVGASILDELSQYAPRGKLTNMKFSPYNLNDSIILLGDAAHAMVPFYGQGLNTGLEDVRVLFEQFIDNPEYENWSEAFDAYSAYRKPDSDAIVDLSVQNYHEMSSGVQTWSFKMRKHLDNGLARVFGDKWLPLYTMVSFRTDVRYSDALKASHWQQKVLDRAIKAVGAVTVAAAIIAVKWSRRTSR